jgi:hypothetical protein
MTPLNNPWSFAPSIPYLTDMASRLHLPLLSNTCHPHVCRHHLSPKSRVIGFHNFVSSDIICLYLNWEHL